MANGGKRAGAGRKPKADELQLVELLNPLDAAAFEAIKQGVQKKDYGFVKLFMEYRYGRPRERVDVTSLGDKLNTAIEVTVIRTTLPNKEE